MRPRTSGGCSSPKRFPIARLSKAHSRWSCTVTTAQTGGLLANRPTDRILKRHNRRLRGPFRLTADQEAAAPSPKTHVATFSDPEAYAAATVNLATGATPRFIGTVGEAFHAKIARVNLDQLHVGIGRASVPVSFTARIPNSHV